MLLLLIILGLWAKMLTHLRGDCCCWPTEQAWVAKTVFFTGSEVVFIGCARLSVTLNCIVRMHTSSDFSQPKALSVRKFKDSDVTVSIHFDGLDSGDLPHESTSLLGLKLKVCSPKILGITRVLSSPMCEAVDGIRDWDLDRESWSEPGVTELGVPLHVETLVIFIGGSDVDDTSSSVDNLSILWAVSYRTAQKTIVQCVIILSTFSNLRS